MEIRQERANKQVRRRPSRIEATWLSDDDESSQLISQHWKNDEDDLVERVCRSVSDMEVSLGGWGKRK